MKRKTKTQLVAEVAKKLGGYVSKAKIAGLSAHTVRELHAVASKKEAFGEFAHGLFGVSKSSAHRDVFGRAVVDHFEKKDGRRKTLAKEIATETGGELSYRRIVKDFSDDQIEETYKAAIMGEDYESVAASEPATEHTPGYLFELIRGPVRTDFLTPDLAMLQAMSKMDNATFSTRTPGVISATFGNGATMRIPIDLWADPDAFAKWADEHSSALTVKLEITHLIGALLGS